MLGLNLNLENSGITEEELLAYKQDVKKYHKELESNKEDETAFLGWIDLPANYDKDEFEKIKRAAAKISKDSDVLLVIGIGGSYLGARAVIEALSNSFYNMLDKKTRKAPQIIFVGNNMSPNYIKDVISYVEHRDFSVNVISKSGTTTEPAISFRLFRELLEAKYGLEEARSRIYVTTDKKKGALKELAKSEKYVSFVIPDNVGGRFSVLTAVGLLPIAAIGIDIDKLMQGANFAREKLNDSSLEYNEAYRYAVARNILLKKNKDIEILESYEPKMQYFIEWWKQLYGESEGKDKKGIFPAGCIFSTDLHSMGQYIQDGRRNLFETVINIETTENKLQINIDEDDLDGLNYLVGKELDYINKMAMKGTIQAHVSGDVPNIRIDIDKLDEEAIGKLIYFFEMAVAMSGKLLGVNPFDQPGVEAYKKNMFVLLEKPGYVEKTETEIKQDEDKETLLKMRANLNKIKSQKENLETQKEDKEEQVNFSKEQDKKMVETLNEKIDNVIIEEPVFNKAGQEEPKKKGLFGFFKK